jgi:hypothetical protein
MEMQAVNRRPSGHVQVSHDAEAPLPPSGNGKPPSNPGIPVPPQALPIFLPLSTTIKIAIPTLTAILGAASLFLYSFHETKVHMQNKVIHVQSESRAEATKARSAMESRMTERQSIALEKMRISQKKHLDDLGSRMRRDQRAILRAVQRVTRR